MAKATKATKQNPRRRKAARRNKNPRKNHSGLGAFLGSIAGGIPGHIMAGLGAGSLAWPVTELGWIAGGAAGGYYGAKEDRRRRGAIGGAIGGIFGPLGAALGGYLGGRHADRASNPALGTTAAAIGAGVLAAGVGYGGYKLVQRRRMRGLPPAKALEQLLLPDATVGDAPYVVADIQQPISLRSTTDPIAAQGDSERVPELRVRLEADPNEPIRSAAAVTFGLGEGLGADENRLLFIDHNGDQSILDTPGGKAIGRLVTGISPEYARLAYELLLIQINEGVNWADPEERDGAIERVLSKLATKVDWSRGLAPYTYGSPAWRAWSGVQLLGSVANQSYFNKQA